MKPTTCSFAIALVLAVTVVLASTPPVWADAQEGTADTVAATILVRGHWVIEAADPDGTVVAVREFHNFLLGLGETQLVFLLAGNRSAGGFAVSLGPQSVSPCAPTPNCLVTELRFPATAGPAVAKTLTKIVSSTPPASITLRGSIQVPGSGDIGTVGTILTSCSSSVASLTGLSTISPANCQTGAGITTFPLGLTVATLTSPVPVVAGQTVLATVTLRFGSAP